MFLGILTLFPSLSVVGLTAAQAAPAKEENAQGFMWLVKMWAPCAFTGESLGAVGTHKLLSRCSVSENDGSDSDKQRVTPASQPSEFSVS